MKRSPSHNTYIPHHLTINTLQNIGRQTTDFTRTKPTLRIRKNNSSGLPKFIKKDIKAFDKENLLQQMRKEKKKQTEMSVSNGKLKRILTTSKMRQVRGKSAQLSDSVYLEEEEPGQFATIAVTLRRELDQLMVLIQKQKEEISMIKRSKKYTRYRWKQLEMMGETYREELAQLREKVRLIRVVKREERRKYMNNMTQKAGVVNLNREICCQLVIENSQLQEDLDEVSDKFENSKSKGLSLRKERDRLLQDINQLRSKIGMTESSQLLGLKPDLIEKQAEYSDEKWDEENQFLNEEEQEEQDPCRLRDSQFKDDYPRGSSLSV